MALRFTAVALACLIVLFLAVKFEAGKQTTIPIGAFAEKDYDRGMRLFRITNAGGGKQSGRFLVFSTEITTRYPVVFLLDSSEVIPSTTTVFTGSCAGVRVTPLPGCNCPAPFVLVVGCVPDSSGSSAKTN